MVFAKKCYKIMTGSERIHNNGFAQIWIILIKKMKKPFDIAKDCVKDSTFNIYLFTLNILIIVFFKLISGIKNTLNYKF